MSVGPAPRRQRRLKGLPDMDPALAADLSQLDFETERRLLRIFRDYLSRRVCLASPLLLNACREGELEAAAWRLRPSHNWPLVQLSQARVRGWSARQTRYGAFYVPRVVRGPDDDARVADQLVLRVTHRTAHMVLAYGQTVVRTSDDGGRIELPGLLTLDEREDLIGGRLDRALSHPCAEGDLYRIRSATLDAARLRTLVMFTAAPAEWRLPWGTPSARFGRLDPV